MTPRLTMMLTAVQPRQMPWPTVMQLRETLWLTVMLTVMQLREMPWLRGAERPLLELRQAPWLTVGWLTVKPRPRT